MTPAPASAEAGIDLAPFKELLLQSCGHSFEAGREQALSAAVSRRMAALDIPGHRLYHDLLLRDRDELLRLTEMLTVNETYFFREPEHLRLLVDTLIPEYLSSRSRPIRILSAGCSTGEEPYSVAIMLRERFGPDFGRLFALSAVDIDSAVIASARAGVYGKGSFRETDRFLLERYFKPCHPERFRVSDDIAKEVSFEVVNLLGNYPKTMRSDVILYRNVSIYFPPPLQREIFGRLAELLADGGALLVGATETMHHDLGILSLVKRDGLFYFRKQTLPFVSERRGVRRNLESSEPGHGGNRAPVGGSGPVSSPQRKPSPPPNFRGRIDEALELARNNRHDKALALLDAVIEADGSHLKAHALKGSILLGISRFEEARETCTALLARDPLCLEAYLMLGIVARQKGDDDEALRRFREALYLDPSCWPAHFYAAEIGLARDDWNRSRNGYQTALRILEQAPEKQGERFFPLVFNAEQFRVICRYKLSQLKNNG